MRSWFLVILTSCWLGNFPLLAFGQQKDHCPQKGYTSWLPAPSPNQAMLLGNGEMGAMVFGHPHDETIIMNHAALYLPLSEPKEPIHQASRLAEIRQLILDGKGTEAAQIPVDISMQEGYGKQIWSDPYIPAFDVKLNISPGNIACYRRYVDFESGEAVVAWTQNGHAFERRQFISRADSIMVIEVKAETTFHAVISFDRRPVAWNEWDYINENLKNTRIIAQDDQLLYHSEFVHQSKGGLAGFDGVGKILDHNGELKSNENNLELIETDHFLLVIKIETFSTAEQSMSKSIGTRLNRITHDYDRLLKAHQRIHTEMFNRVAFNLEDSDSTSHPDSEVMNLQLRDNVTQQAIVDKFYAARYNILSATGVNPPNLQGIWGSSFQPPWSSDYTHDGNLPVAISSFLCSNLPELMLPYFDYHDARMDDYRENARRLYGCKGIQVPSHSSSRGYNVHFDPVWCLTFWNGGAAWTAHFYYDYWLYTHDTSFLVNRAYPFMKEAALFQEDFLCEGENGRLVFNPSYSPENNPGNLTSQATINATMDVMLTKELLRNLLSCSKMLNEDANKLAVWKQMFDKLPDYEVDSAGMLREWLWPGYTENLNHRHVSQLYGVYDRMDPEIAASNELMDGARKVLEEKLTMRKAENGGIMVFGLVQLAWVAANLGDAAKVEEILHLLSSRYWSDSQATYHDPDGLFNMDLSGGYQTAVIRALIHSDEGRLILLPAKPSSWKKGSISGLAARNQLQVHELKWDQQRLEVEVESPVQQTITLIYPAEFEIDRSRQFIDGEITSGKTKTLEVLLKPHENTCLRFTTTNQNE